MNIAFVVANPASLNSVAETPWKSHMEGVGHTVTYKDDDDSSWDPTSYDLIAVSGMVATGKIGWLHSAAVGIVSFSRYTNTDLKFSSNYQLLGNADINITDNTHDITNPFSTGLLTVYNGNYSAVGLYNYGPGFSSLAYCPADNTRIVLGIYNTGDEMISSYLAPARRVHLGLFYCSKIIADGWTLFERAVTWARGPVANPYPKEWINRKVISGFHCFLGAYIKAKILGYDPLKLPDGTIF